MKQIPRLVEGESYPNAFSAEFMNEIVDTCNAVRSMRGVGGVKIHIAESGYVIDGSGSFGTGSFGSGSDGSGSVIYDGRDTWL